jgi:putative RecB family exonuclease
LTLRGIVDRLDEAPDGSVRVVDYKSGRAPGSLFEQRALFQVKFYATVLWRSTGVVPTEVMLVYLASGERLRHRVDPESLPRFEAQLPRLWEAVERAARTGDFRARPSRLCDWCDHKARCPVWGNTPPPLAEDAVQRLLGVTATA